MRELSWPHVRGHSGTDRAKACLNSRREKGGANKAESSSRNICTIRTHILLLKYKEPHKYRRHVVCCGSLYNVVKNKYMWYSKVDSKKCSESSLLIPGGFSIRYKMRWATTAMVHKEQPSATWLDSRYNSTFKSTGMPTPVKQLEPITKKYF